MTKSMTKWFYHTNRTVNGPVTTEELKALLPTFSDAKKTFIWSRGYTEWVSADRWQPQSTPQNIIHPAQPLEKTKPSFNDRTQTYVAAAETTGTGAPNTDAPDTIEVVHDHYAPTAIHHNADFDATQIPTKIDADKFRVQLNFVDQPPMTKDELLSFAASVDDPSQIAIFDPKLQEWKEIYSFKEIVTKLGLTRRKHPRVPILAQFTGKTSKHMQLNARLVTISIGGLGLTDVFDLNVGDIISGQITSPHFYSPVTFEAEATYCGNDGYVGLKFIQINDDSLSLVTDYVRRFASTN